MAAGTIPCSKCKKEKPRSEFSKRHDRKRGYESECKQCKRLRMVKYDAVSYSKNREKSLWNKYKLTIEEWDEMFKSQKGCCAICGIHQSLLKVTLFTDHDHITGKVRGLLCPKCNDGLGRFCADEGTDLLKSAVQYLGGK